MAHYEQEFSRSCPITTDYKRFVELFKIQNELQRLPQCELRQSLEVRIKSVLDEKEDSAADELKRLTAEVTSLRKENKLLTQRVSELSDDAGLVPVNREKSRSPWKYMVALVAIIVLARALLDYFS